MTDRVRRTSFNWKMRNLDKNERSDDFLGRVIKAQKLRVPEIDAIADAPHLLASVRARIEAESEQNVSSSPVSARALRWAFFTIPAASLVLIAFLGLFFVTLGSGGEEIVYIAPPPLDAVEDLPEIEVPEYRVPAGKFAPLLQPARRIEVHQVMLRKKAKPRIPVPKIKRAAPEPLEFYALAGVGNPADGPRDARIVRVDMPRASLLALGVNLPIEGEGPLVRTDLLLGSDGVAKAIRLVE